MPDIQDKVVIITGASSGIGEVTAKELGSKGVSCDTPFIINIVNVETTSIK